MTAESVAVVIVLIALAAIAAAGASVRAVRQDEAGVVFRLGRVRPPAREPGIAIVVPFIDRLERVPMRTRVADAPPEETVTRDDVAMRVGAAVHVRVIDPIAATVSVADHLSAVAQLAGTTLRSFIAHCDFDELAGTDHGQINAQIRDLIAEATEASWGLRIEQVEIVAPQSRTEDSSSAG